MKKSQLKTIIEDNTTRSGRVFDYFIQILILISLVTFTIETTTLNQGTLKSIIYYFEIVCVMIFTSEYLLRVWLADKPIKYIFSFYGVVDLLAILPFFIGSAMDLRALRVFRVFRVFRSLKLIRYNSALHRFHLAGKVIKEELILFFIVSTILIFLSASGIYFFESKAQPEHFSSIPQSLWWSIVTLTTVGYGDVYPITQGGRIFTTFVLVVGVGVVTVPAGLVATALSKARELEKEEKEEKEDGKRR